MNDTTNSPAAKRASDTANSPTAARPAAGPRRSGPERASDTANWFIGFPVAAGPWLAGLEPPPHGARLFVADDVHVTVAFLGAVGHDAAHEAWRAAATLDIAAWTMSPGRLAPFGDPRRPSAWSVEPTPPVPTAEAAIGERDALYAAAGVPGHARDRRPPRPHATLARPRRAASSSEHDALRAWAERQHVPPVPIRIERLALYTWAEDRRARLFRVVAERHL